MRKKTWLFLTDCFNFSYLLSHIRYLLVLSTFFFSGVTFAIGNSQNQDNSQNSNSIATDQAKREYRVYLEKLKELSKQYSQVTAEVKKVIQEEGVPTWNDKSGKIEITHDLDFSENGPFKETEKEIRLVLEAPGLKKESIRVSVKNGNILHIQAIKKATDPEGREEPYEENYRLPSPVQDKNTSAKYQDGVLSVTLQKIDKNTDILLE